MRAPEATVVALLDGAGRSVEAIVEGVEGPGDRDQRVAFAVKRLADALALTGIGMAELGPTGAGIVRTAAPARSAATGNDNAGTDASDPAEAAGGLHQSTRQAIQVGVAPAARSLRCTWSRSPRR